IFKNGKQNKVSLMIGNNQDEAIGFVPDFARGLPLDTEDDYKAVVRGFYGPNADAILARYPASAYASPTLALDALATDFAFLTPTRKVYQLVAAHQKNVYVYFFTHALEGAPSFG